MCIRIAATVMLAALAVAAGVAAAPAQTRTPTAAETRAIRDCAAKNFDTEDGGESCLFKLVADPCTQTPEGSSNQGTANCYRLETVIWDALLNDNYRALKAELDDKQETKLREMQRAWIASRDRTCAFYYDKAQGTMAVPMTAACLLRETARRALLLKAFSGL